MVNSGFWIFPFISEKQLQVALECFPSCQSARGEVGSALVFVQASGCEQSAGARGLELQSCRQQGTPFPL